MKKRATGCLIMGMMAAAVLTGCSAYGKKQNTGQDGKTSAAVAETEKNETKKVSRKRVSIEAIQAENLTDQLEELLCIDYLRPSCKPVQDFSYRLFLQSMEEENPVLSPVSAYLALGMVSEGAKGETLDEFHAILDESECLPDYLMNILPREEEGMTISLANSVWVDEKMEPDQQYLTKINSFFDAEVYRSNLGGEQTMEDINTWVNYHTNGMIPKLLEMPLAEEDRLALFNTIYFKGGWADGFDANSTRQKDFHTEDGEELAVDMMQKYGEYQQYIKGTETEGVLLPYKDETIAFVALKPAANSTVREMCSQLTWEKISQLIRNRERTLCNLKLPKFEITFSKKLNDSLKNMGLTKAFDGREADLTGLGSTQDGENLFISLVQQDAAIIVDENGTEAAAVTEVVISERAVEYVSSPINVIFDTPFLYMIVDLENEIPLFIGIMDNPNA